MLKNKNILLCISGSIAIYKSLELARTYIKAGASVKVLMSEDAKDFISPLTFEAICGKKVLHEGTENWNDEYNHIKITKDADVVVLCPATANTINKLNAGVADNLLTQTLLANTKPLLIAPAMNTYMYTNFTTQKSLENLKKYYHIISPISKQLACLDEGVGALAEVEDIFYKTCRIVHEDKFWASKNVLITGGGTREKIDDVRYIGNFSSGLMARNLALAFYMKGANVTLLTSAKSNHLPFETRKFDSSEELEKKTQKLLLKNDFLFMAAAVSDYIINPKKGNLKKSEIGEVWHLELKQNRDILKNLDKNGKKIIGFKAEFDEENAFKNAKEMLESKNLDGVCLNILGREVNFGSEQSEITFVSKDGVEEFSLKDKLKIGFEIANKCKEL